MVKSRSKIPVAIKEKVLKEFNHRCAICAKDRPQIHHIDKNPENNDQNNLIPLCPNCHLTDQHNPTQPLHPDLLSLFRRFKDPLILKPQFYPIFKRFEFLYQVNESSYAPKLDDKAEELIEFIGELKMGSFYSKKLDKLLRMRNIRMPIALGNDNSEKLVSAMFEISKKEYLSQLATTTKEVEYLVVEILRYQEWN